MQQIICAFASLFAAFLLANGGLYAQDFRGSLLGTVSDTSGGRIDGALIEVRAQDSSIERRSASDSHGQFRLDDLPPGNYSLTGQAAGFTEARSEVIIVVSSVREIAVTLQPASVRETVNVVAGMSSITIPTIDTTSVVHGGAVMAQELQTFPLANRTFANIAYLIPGTEPVEPSDPTKARITAVSVGGSSGLNNVLSVDGGDNSDDYIGGFLQNFSMIDRYRLELFFLT
jgi:hypothetical protein